MSVVTKTGDDGTTGLMYNRRVAKHHPRVEAYGSVDELNAALGVARATGKHEFIGSNLLAIQKDLISLMGELATLPEDLPRYRGDGYPTVGPQFVEKLDALVAEIESVRPPGHGWAVPGEDPVAAALEIARTACRRAERQFCRLKETDPQANLSILIYLNRLSDLLWLMARWCEAKPRSSG